MFVDVLAGPAAALVRGVAVADTLEKAPAVNVQVLFDELK